MLTFGISGLLSFLTGVMITDNHTFVCRRYRLFSDKVRLPEGKKSLRILSLADFHNQNFGDGNTQLVETIQRLRPDLILIPGDLITVKHTVRMQQALSFIRRISKVAPVYYGLGNHENRLLEKKKEYGVSYTDFCRSFEKAGAVILNNRSVTLPAYGIRLSAYTIPDKYYQKIGCPKISSREIRRRITPAGEDVYNILLAHNPDGFPAYKEWGADLTLAGHIHGGLMIVPGLGGLLSPNLELFPKYDGGIFHKGNADMIVSRGLGTHTLPIRIFNPGELSVIDIYRHPRKG